MAISINWLTRVITVPKADMVLIQLTPTEVRELPINWFRLALKDIEDGDGMPFQTTHYHYPEVNIGGLVLARVVEILPPYTITFEDGQYSVNLTGANSNIADRVNANQVSVRSFNSAGMTSSPLIEHASFGGGVSIDVVNGTSGTVFPAGTTRYPVNNLAQAKEIASFRGFNTFFVTGSLTIGATDVISGYEFVGQGASFTAAYTTIVLTDGCTTANTTFRDLKISGRQNGECNYHDCVIHELTNTHCKYDNCGLVGPIGKNNAGWTVNHSADYVACRTNSAWFILDCNASPMTQVFSRLSGKIKIINQTNASARTYVQLHAGQVWVDASCTSGAVTVVGVGLLQNDSVIVVNSDGLVNGPTIADSVWDEPTADHVTAGTTGKALIDAGAAGNPWGAPVVGNTDAGTFGELVGKKLLTIAKFLGLK
ncbi:MAG: hypothetical protein ABIK13_04315 [Patescibacteria group bacterium]